MSRKNGNPKLGETLKGARRDGVNSKLEEAFFNDSDPRLALVQERPWHRLAIFLAAQGRTQKEIAERLNRTEASVSTVLRQPWARERIQNEISEAGRDVINGILETAAPNALLGVIDLAERASSETVRLAARKELLDRYLGKPNQPVEHKGEIDLEKLSDTELAKMIPGPHRE